MGWGISSKFKRLDKALGTLFAAFLLFAPITNVRAQNTGINGTNLQFYTPAVDPYGFFGVEGYRLLRAGDFYLSISQDFAINHILQVGINGVPVDIVDDIFTTDLVGSYAVTNFFTINLDIPIHVFARETNINTLASFTTSSLGDIRMALKFRLLEESDNRPGIAVLFFNTFPTGNERKFLGTSHVSPGFNFSLGKTFKYFRIASNFGAEFPQQKNILGVSFNDRITYGAATEIPFVVIDPTFSFIGEIRGHFEPGTVRIVTSPVEFTVGVRKTFHNGLILSAAGGAGWNNAIGNPRARALLSLGYSPHFGDDASVYTEWEVPAIATSQVYGDRWNKQYSLLRDKHERLETDVRRLHAKRVRVKRRQKELAEEQASLRTESKQLRRERRALEAGIPLMQRKKNRVVAQRNERTLLIAKYQARLDSLERQEKSSANHAKRQREQRELRENISVLRGSVHSFNGQIAAINKKPREKKDLIADIHKRQAKISDRLEEIRSEQITLKSDVRVLAQNKRHLRSASKNQIAQRKRLEKELRAETNWQWKHYGLSNRQQRKYARNERELSTLKGKKIKLLSEVESLEEDEANTRSLLRTNQSTIRSMEKDSERNVKQQAKLNRKLQKQQMNSSREDQAHTKREIAALKSADRQLAKDIKRKKRVAGRLETRINKVLSRQAKARDKQATVTFKIEEYQAVLLEFDQKYPGLAKQNAMRRKFLSLAQDQQALNNRLRK